MSLNYTTYVSQLSNLLVIGSTDPNFNTMLPGVIDYAEQRIYRDLDILNSRSVDATTTFSSGVRNFTIPSANGTFIIIESINAISASSGTRNQMLPVTKEFLDAVYPNPTVTGPPQYFATITSTYFIIGPAPDSSYTAEVIGVIRPAPLSSANSSTFLTSYCPELFIAASMVFATGYQRDFGSESDDPRMGSMSWEPQYQQLMQTAQQEQMRAKFIGSAWGPMIPAAGPPPRV